MRSLKRAQAPTEDKPLDKTYTVKYLGNVVGEKIMHGILSSDFYAYQGPKMEIVRDGDKITVLLERADGKYACGQIIQRAQNDS